MDITIQPRAPEQKDKKTMIWNIIILPPKQANDGKVIGTNNAFFCWRYDAEDFLHTRSIGYHFKNGFSRSYGSLNLK